MDFKEKGVVIRKSNQKKKIFFIRLSLTLLAKYFNLHIWTPF